MNDADSTQPTEEEDSATSGRRLRRSTAIGRYQLFGSLGRGGMADVYLGVARGPLGVSKLAVVKCLRAELAVDPAFSSMLVDEARLAARLSHPNIVNTYEVGEADGEYFIAMEYLEGQPLVRVARAAARAGRKLEAPLCARIVADALSALHYAHELRDYDGSPLQIIHRDVSPHNVFLTYDGTVKLMDFGIAKAVSNSTQTAVGVLKGKFAYMAPEQATGGGIDRRADIFSMGIVLWELLAGRRLFGGGNAALTLQRVLVEPIPRIAQIEPGIEPALDAIVSRALERDPAKRFQTAKEMRRTLEDYLAASGYVFRPDELGHRVAQMFVESRRRTALDIQRHMASATSATSTGQLQAIHAPAIPSLLPPPPAPEVLDRFSSLPPMTSGASGRHDAVAATPTSKRKRAAIALLGLVLLVGVTLLLADARRWGPRAGDAAPSNAAVVAASAAAPAPPPSPASPPSLASPAHEAIALRELPTASAPIAPPSRPSRSAPPARARAAAPPRTPPSSAASIAATAAPAAPVGTGYLTLDTYPWTSVSEEGRPLGVTPLVRLSLPVGVHVLTLENGDRGIRQAYTVTVRPNETVSKRLGLE